MEKFNLETIGLKLILNFITEEEEKTLVEKFPKFTQKTTKGRNSIQRFGSDLPYKSNIVSKKIPEHLIFLSDRIMEQNLLDVAPNSISINEYCIGQSITPHIDSKTSGKIITILSLLSDATMVFEKNKINQSLVLPARSLVQMSGEIRNEWMHSIKPVENFRYSIVFRCGTA